MGYLRATAYHEAVIAAPVEQVWALLNDWAGILKWWPKEGAAFPMIECTLIGEEDAIPRIRRVVLEGGGVGIERLILSNSKSRRIYYQLDDGGIPGVANYLATTMVDPAEGGGTLMRFSSNFDVLPGVESAVAQGIILSVYKTIALGFSQKLGGA